MNFNVAAELAGCDAFLALEDALLLLSRKLREVHHRFDEFALEARIMWLDSQALSRDAHRLREVLGDLSEIRNHAMNWSDCFRNPHPNGQHAIDSYEADCVLMRETNDAVDLAMSAAMELVDGIRAKYPEHRQ